VTRLLMGGQLVFGVGFVHIGGPVMTKQLSI